MHESVSTGERGGGGLDGEYVEKGARIFGRDYVCLFCRQILFLLV